MKSIYLNLGGGVKMPEFQGRLLYMHKSDMGKVSLPANFQDYTSVIDNILGKVKDRNNVCYITIHEKHVKSETHRREGIHCDFNWYESMSAHGEPSGTHSNPLPQKPEPAGKWDTGRGSWKNETSKGGMLLVSNHAGCRAWRGDFEGEIKEGGDCSAIDVSHLENEVIPSGEVYYINATGIHESLPIEDAKRSLIRINFHPEYEFQA